ncbi:MAG: SlyX family protein [Herminiimonas sp.]|nr:SlyX family protein [Herminiimonas sp.]
MPSEERLTEIEIKVARQEDLLDTLNQMVYQQEKKIGELESLCAALARHVKAASTSDSDESNTDERPPHY